MCDNVNSRWNYRHSYNFFSSRRVNMLLFAQFIGLKAIYAVQWTFGIVADLRLFVLFFFLGKE